MKKITHIFITSLLCSLAIFYATTLCAQPSEYEDDLSGGFLKIGFDYKFEQTPYHDEKMVLQFF